MASLIYLLFFQDAVSLYSFMECSFIFFTGKAKYVYDLKSTAIEIMATRYIGCRMPNINGADSIRTYPISARTTTDTIITNASDIAKDRKIKPFSLVNGPGMPKRGLKRLFVIATSPNWWLSFTVILY